MKEAGTVFFMCLLVGFVGCGDSSGPGGAGDSCSGDDDCRGALRCNEQNLCYDPTAADGDGDSDSDSDTDTDIDGDIDADADGDGLVDGDRADSDRDEDFELPPDLDGDGLSDACEDSTEGLDRRDFDSDDDGIPDGVEDANHNCIVDDGETDPTLTDTDSDGLRDGLELLAPSLCVASQIENQRVDPLPPCSTDDDCLEDESCVPLDPLEADGDGDGLLDGEEDLNRDGVIDVDEGETDPRLADSDGDGRGDDREPSVRVCNLDELVTPIEVESSRGDYTVAIDPRFSMGRSVLITDLGPADVHAGAVAEGLNDGVALFMLSKPPADAVTDAFAQDVADETAMSAIDGITSVTPLSNRQPFMSHDGFGAVSSLRLVETAEASSPSDVADLLTVELSGRRDYTSVAGDTGTYVDAMSTSFVVRLTTVWRSDSQVILLAAVALRSVYEDDARPSAIMVRDFTNTTGLALHGFTVGAGCDMFVVEQVPMAEFIWVVDTSGSTADDIERISLVADQFFETLSLSGVDYRMGVRAACDADMSPVMSLDVPDGMAVDNHPLTISPPKFAHRIVHNGGTAINNCENPLAAGLRAYDWLIEQPPTHGIREGALVIMVVVSDEEEHNVEMDDDGGRNCSLERIEQAARVQTLVDRYSNPDGDPTTKDGIMVFGIISPHYEDSDGDPQTCDGLPPEACGMDGDDSVASRVVIRATGGTEAPICSSQPEEELAGITEATINAMIDVVQGRASTYWLDETPISSTLELALRGRVAPRSRDDGFDYDSASNTVVFHNRSITSVWRPRVGDEFAVSYRLWQRRQPDMPDLVAYELTPDMSSCYGGYIGLSGRFGNEGAAPVDTGVRVSFYTGTPAGEHSLIATVLTEEDIPVGVSTVWVDYDFHTDADLTHDLYVTIDDRGDGTGLIDETDEHNNTAFLLGVVCPGVY